MKPIITDTLFMFRHTKYRFDEPRPTFIIDDLPSVLILIIADQILNDSLCCSYKYI